MASRRVMRSAAFSALFLRSSLRWSSAAFGCPDGLGRTPSTDTPAGAAPDGALGGSTVSPHSGAFLFVARFAPVCSVTAGCISSFFFCTQWVTVVKKMMDQQVRNLRKSTTKMIADLNLTVEDQFNMAFMVGILNDDNTISFDENEDGSCTFLQRMHNLYELTLRMMHKASTVRTPSVDLSVLNGVSELNELADEIERSGGTFLTVACVWFFLIVKTYGFINRHPTGKEPPIAIASSDAQRSLFAQLCNELVEFHKEATTTGTAFKLPGIKETGDAAAATTTTTTTWQGMTFPCSPAEAKQHTSSMLERLQKGYNFVDGGQQTLYSRPSTDAKFGEGFYFSEEVKKGGSSQEDAVDLC